MMVGYSYHVVYFLQILSCIYASSLWVAIDTINFGLLAHHNVMLKILSQRIASLGWSETENKMDSNNYKKICDYVKYHVQISR